MAQVIQNVSDTAFMVAGFRVETERVQPLFAHEALRCLRAADHDLE